MNPLNRTISILIFHPEGNLANNPNLSAMVGLLSDRGHEVSITAPDRPFSKSTDMRVENIVRRRLTQRIVTLLGRTEIRWKLGRHIPEALLRRRTFDVAIGVDRQGLLEAAAYARQRLPFGLVSYEIFFDDECAPGFKQLERQVATQAMFALDLRRRTSPPPLRAETGIPQSRIATMPVAGTDTYQTADWSRTSELTGTLGIDPSKRIAILAGSLEEWAVAPDIIARLQDWPRDWVLVVNDRYSRSPQWLQDAAMEHRESLYVLPGRLEHGSAR